MHGCISHTSILGLLWKGTVIRTTAVKMLESQREFVCQSCKYSFSVKVCVCVGGMGEELCWALSYYAVFFKQIVPFLY